MKENKYVVSIIIVNWNGKGYLQTCLRSLLKVKTQYPYEIIIADNGSVDGSIEFIKEQKKKFKNIILIENGKNLGFAEANNIGFTVARGEYIFFLNNDTEVPNSFLDPLVNVLRTQKNIAAVQPKILLMDDHEIIDSVGSFFTNTGILFHRGHKQKDKKLYEKQYKIFSMKGAAMLIRKKVLDTVGLFDNDYFAYFEETDLGHRMLLAGHSIEYIPTSTVYHKGGGTTDKVGSSFIQFHSFKNRIMSYTTNFERRTLLRIMPIHISICLLASIGFIGIGRPGHSYAIVKALYWNIRNIKKILQKRNHVQTKIRKIKDSQYLPSVTKEVTLTYYYYLFTGRLDKFRERGM